MRDELNQNIYISGEIVDNDATRKLEELFEEAEKSNKRVVQIEAIDIWEERRYQIAKEVFANTVSPQRMATDAYYAVLAADTLIEELKKQAQ